jgi:hypothetical protein
MTLLGGPYWENTTRQERLHRFSHIIVEESFRQGLPSLNPLVVICVVFAESSFRHTARGQRGEVGLFQVMPRGHAAGGRSERQLSDPVENIRAGFEDLRRGLSECGQGTAGALAWHNLGRCVEDPDTVAFVRRIRALYQRVEHLRPERDGSTEDPLRASDGDDN